MQATCSTGASPLTAGFHRVSLRVMRDTAATAVQVWGPGPSKVNDVMERQTYCWRFAEGRTYKTRKVWKSRAALAVITLLAIWAIPALGNPGRRSGAPEKSMRDFYISPRGRDSNPGDEGRAIPDISSKADWWFVREAPCTFYQAPTVDTQLKRPLRSRLADHRRLLLYGLPRRNGQLELLDMRTRRMILGWGISLLATTSI